MATRIKVTDRFTIMAGNGDKYRIVKKTEFAVMHTVSGEQERSGKVWYETEDGRGVNAHGDGTYTIPTLNVTAVDNRAVQ